MASYKQTLLAVFSTLTIGLLHAQNNTNSPYAYSGIGETEYGYMIHNKALGGVASSVFSNNRYNLVNPATLGFIDKTIIDFGFKIEKGTLSTGSAHRDFNNGNFNYFSLAFRTLNFKTRHKTDTLFNADQSIKKIRKSENLFSWVAGVSISPYSNIGGDFQQKHDTSFASSLILHNASGDLTSVGFNNGFKIGEYASLGYTLSFIWGQVNKNKLVTFPDSQNITTIQDLKFTEYNGFEHKFGLGFNIPIQNKSIVSAGMSYRLSHYLNTTQTRVVRSSDYNIQGVLVPLDTILFTEGNRSSSQIPSFMSVGLTYTLKEKFSIGGEYSFQDWSSVIGKGWTDEFAKYSRISIGLTINPESKPTLSMHNPEIYVGFTSAKLSAVYHNAAGKIEPIKETGISFGIGLPIVRDVFTMDGKREKYKSMLYLSGEYLKRGEITDGRIREDLFRISVGLSLTDLWFIKRKYR
ncbi:MAG: outer membrane protein transport protein [Bacteroidia bacterium]|nr:outer membrane protein transport protein [Bacteroidia bacterium]